MKNLYLVFTVLLFASCNNTAVQKVADSMTPDAEVVEIEKKAGYLKTADATYELSLGDNSAVDIWDRFLDAHNNQDMDAIMALEAEDIKIWGPDGAVIEGKEAHKEFLSQWFAAANPKWSTYFSVPLNTNMEEQPGTWVTNGHTLTLTIDGVESSSGNISDAYIEDGLVKMFYVFKRELPDSNEESE